MARTVIGRIIAWVWRMIFRIAPIPGFLVPYERPFINWYVAVLEACYRPTWEEDIKAITRQFLDEVAEVLGESIEGGLIDGDKKEH